jgi:hypothetical protein
MCPLCHEPFSPENPGSTTEVCHASEGGDYQWSPVCRACAEYLEVSAAASEYQ